MFDTLEFVQSIREDQTEEFSIQYRFLYQQIFQFTHHIHFTDPVIEYVSVLSYSPVRKFLTEPTPCPSRVFLPLVSQVSVVIIKSISSRQEPRWTRHERRVISSCYQMKLSEPPILTCCPTILREGYGVDVRAYSGNSVCACSTSGTVSLGCPTFCRPFYGSVLTDSLTLFSVGDSSYSFGSNIKGNKAVRISPPESGCKPSMDLYFKSNYVS